MFLATDINLPGAVDWVMMQSCFGDNFMLVLEKQERYEGQQLFYAIVQLIGTKKQAENFAYRYGLRFSVCLDLYCYSFVSKLHVLLHIDC